MRPGGAVGAVLSQEDKGQEHVVAYFSRQRSKAERNYATIEREALAVETAVKEFYPYLYGHTFRLITDHNPLTTLTKRKDVGDWQKKVSMLANEAWLYGVLLMNGSVGCWPMPVYELSRNVAK